MRVSLLFALSYLFAAVSAGGYQECLGRIWMYQAYQIDALNDQASQTIGFKCKKWDDDKQTCDGEWQECKKFPARCNFDEWTRFMGKAPKPTGWAAYRSGSTTRLDIEETSKICYTRFITESLANVPKVHGPKPYHVMKGTNKFYNDQIKKVSKMVNDSYDNKRTSENQHLWDDLDDAVKKIVIARAGDHGPFAIEEAKKYFKDVLEIKTEDLGTNPGSGEKWEKVDWEKTRDEAVSGGTDPDKKLDGEAVDKKFREFFVHLYGTKGDTSAREHLSVIRSFKRARDRDVSCR